MSETPPPPPPQPPSQPPGHEPSLPSVAAAPAAVYRADPPGAGLAEVWISAAIGAILLMMGARFGRYLLALATGQPFHTGVTWTMGPRAGAEVAYPELQGFAMLTDASLFLFGLVLVIDAIVLYFAGGRRLWLVALGFALTVAVTLFNGFVCIRMFGGGIMPIMSLLAVAFGVYTALQQWQLIDAIRRARGTRGAGIA